MNHSLQENTFSWSVFFSGTRKLSLISHILKARKQEFKQIVNDLQRYIQDIAKFLYDEEHQMPSSQTWLLPCVNNLI